LDPESATTLIAMYHEIEEENSTPTPKNKSYNPVESPESRTSQKDYINRESINHRATLENSRVQQTHEINYCMEHTDELINYFCFQCNTSNICAECVIHGSHKGHDVQTIKKAYPLICSKLEDLKTKVNANIEELISSQQKLDMGKKDIKDQITGIKKKISETFNDLKQHIERKEQELLREVDDFEEQNVKQVDHLLRLANGRAINLSEHTQSIKQVLNQYDQRTACDFYSKNYEHILDFNISDLPQLENIAHQAQARFQISAQNFNEIMEGLQNFKLDIGHLHLEMNTNFKEQPAQKRSVPAHEERGRMTHSQGPANIFELGYK
jgi:hypothetical protein